MFEIVLTPEAIGDMRSLRKFERQHIIDELKSNSSISRPRRHATGSDYIRTIWQNRNCVSVSSAYLYDVNES